MADLMADPFQWLDDILPAKAEPCIGRGTKTGMRIDDGQDSELVAEGQLVMNRMHCPDILRANGLVAIVA